MDNVFGKIWLCVLLPHESVHRNILPKIASEIKNGETLDELHSEDLMSEILKAKLFVFLVESKLYPKLVQFLIKKSYETDNGLDYDVKRAIDDLLARKYYAEAGALKMTSMGIPNALRGFSQSILMKLN
jgi:hypothetical protein